MGMSDVDAVKLDEPGPDKTANSESPRAVPPVTEDRISNASPDDSNGTPEHGGDIIGIDLGTT
ncbi:MAG: hypothetical protein JWL81_3440, partial [Verrucomicrobiales bacterium]|nr:hypothetical protein [Verrucomicrobiales bacterium]